MYHLHQPVVVSIVHGPHWYGLDAWCALLATENLIHQREDTGGAVSKSLGVLPANAASTLSKPRIPICVRVSMVAVPRCGRRKTLGALGTPGGREVLRCTHRAPRQQPSGIAMRSFAPFSGGLTQTRLFSVNSVTLQPPPSALIHKLASIRHARMSTPFRSFCRASAGIFDELEING
jgi:hypothetical protein